MRLFKNKYFVKTVLTLSAVMAFGAAEAQASVYLWQSVDKTVEVTFPDTWKRVSNQGVNDILTVKAPGMNDHAECVINARTDERFKIYPRDYAPHIQQLYYSQDMWKDYYARETGVVFHDVVDNAGLGRGFASMASTSYETAVGAKMVKRSVAFAALFGNVAYTVECSAEASAYDRWHKHFMSFIKAIDFPAQTNYAFSGHYWRDFVNDANLKVRGPSITEDTYR